MRPSRLLAIAGKEFIHVFRDPRSLGMAIGIPMVLLLLFGYALTLDVDRVPMVVWDQSRTQASREFISRFTGSRYFSLVRFVDSPWAIERAIDVRDALLGVTIPSDFARQTEPGRVASVQIIVDGSDSNTASIAMAYLRIIGLTYSRDMAVYQAGRLGGTAVYVPVDMRLRAWFNTDMESRNFIFPGLIAVIMMIIAALITSLTVAREWERGTMEQLISTPVRGSELILGKLIPYFAIGMFDVFLAFLMGEFLFRVPFRGSLALFFGMAAVFLAGTQSLGILISVVSRNQLMASQLAMVLTFVPSFLLSGFMYAIANMPQPIQLITYLVPARYFISLLRGVYLKGVGLQILAAEAALLTAFSAAMVVLALVMFKKKLE